MVLLIVHLVTKGLEFIGAEIVSILNLSILKASLIKEVREGRHSIERSLLSVSDDYAAHSNDCDCNCDLEGRES